MTPVKLKFIKDIIEELFEKTRMRLLGPNYVSKAFLFSVKDFDPSNTLASMYLHSISNHAITQDAVDPDTIKRINETFDSYLGVLQNKTQENIETTIKNYMHEADVKAKLAGILSEDYLKTDDGKNIASQAIEFVKSTIDKTDNHINLLVTNEMHNAQSLGALDGIIGMS